MTLDLTKFCRNIKLLRTLHGYSQEELSAAIHLARSTYSAYETGTKIPDLQTVDALSAVYNIGFDSLINYDLTEGLINRIYFNQKNKNLGKLMNDYQSLSLASRNLVLENLNILLDREAALYHEYAKPLQNAMKLHEQHHDQIDDQRNRCDRNHRT